MKQVLPEKILLGLLGVNFSVSDPPSGKVDPGRLGPRFGSTLLAEYAAFTALEFRRAKEYRAIGLNFFIYKE